METQAQITVVIADDHPLVRDGLQRTLEDSPDLSVVGLAGDGTEAVGLAQQFQPQVVVMDVLMPNKNGIEACREICTLLPDTQVLMLSALTEHTAVVDAVAAGASGYLSKLRSTEDLIEAVQAVSRGELRIPNRSVRHMFAQIRGEGDLPQVVSKSALTAREQEIVSMYAGGMSYSEIAAQRGTKPVSMRNAVYRIQDKLGLRSKQALVVWAMRQGLLDDSSDQL